MYSSETDQTMVRLETEFVLQQTPAQAELGRRWVAKIKVSPTQVICPMAQTVLMLKWF